MYYKILLCCTGGYWLVLLMLCNYTVGSANCCIFSCNKMDSCLYLITGLSLSRVSSGVFICILARLEYVH